MKITATTRPLGLLGYPVAHSKSPQMLNRVCELLNIPAVYLAYAVEPEQLSQAVAGMRAMGFIGFNVTIPHKVAIIPLLDELDETALEIGAVNTVVQRDGKLIGYNTDGIGYLRSLQTETNVDLTGKTVTLLGAGGAARAVATTLAKAGVEKIVIANRTIVKAEELALMVSRWTSTEAVALENVADAVARSQLLVNTTSLGMAPNVDASPIPIEWLHSKLLVSDLIYRPRETKLLQAANSIGAQTHGGLGMLLHQAAVAVEHWFDQAAPLTEMWEILERE
jgi:shikimate dehydrogenase